ncbi:hypothetical protein BAC1_01594 [uncultured bacterium]|nr:hypothetical protein BAC1_01594 [uncultured bacterium]
MAERELDILIAAKDVFSKPLTQAERAFQNFSDKVEGSSQNMEKRFDSLGNSIMGIRAAWLEVAGVVASAAWLVEGAKQALEGEKAMNRLRVQIQSLGLNYHSLKGHVEEVLESTSRYAMVQDDDVASVLQELIFLTGDYSASVQNLNLVFDLAYQRNISHSEAASLVSKAMSGNIEAISKVIPELRILDDALGNNATAAKKAAAAMDFLSGRVSGAVNEMTDHERKVAEVTLAYNQLWEAMGNVTLEMAHFELTQHSLGGLLQDNRDAAQAFMNIYKYLRYGEQEKEQNHPLSTTYKPRFNISKTAQGTNGIDDSINYDLSERIQMTENGLKALPPALDVPLSLNWTMLSDSVGMESDVSRKITALMEAERLAAQDSLLNLESPYNPKYTGTDQISSVYQEYDQKLIALEGFNQRKLELMMAAGASELEIEAAHAELSNQYAASRRDFQINAAGQTLGAMSNFMQNMYTMAGSKNRAMFQMMKAFAISEAVIHTAKAATDALDAPPGPPFSFAYVAATVAAGAAQIATIASSEPGSKQTVSATGVANPSYSGGSPTAYPIPTRTDSQPPPAPISITLVVNTLDGKDVNWSRVIEDNLAPALEKYSKDGNRPLDIRVTKN